jgi:hypothetical protein
MSRKREDLQILWQARLKEIEGSSLSVREYCRKNSLTIHQYYYWRRKINSPGVYTAGEEDHFTEVIFAQENNESSGLRISLGNGIEIIPEKGFSEYEFLKAVSLLRRL